MIDDIFQVDSGSRPDGVMLELKRIEEAWKGLDKLLNRALRKMIQYDGCLEFNPRNQNVLSSFLQRLQVLEDYYGSSALEYPKVEGRDELFNQLKMVWRLRCRFAMDAVSYNSAVGCYELLLQNNSGSGTEPVHVEELQRVSGEIISVYKALYTMIFRCAA